MIKPKILLGKCRETFWAQIHALVISFNSQAAEYETEMDFLQDLVGPVDPSHPKNTRYKGRAIVFRTLGGVACRNFMKGTRTARVEEGTALQTKVSDEVELHLRRLPLLLAILATDPPKSSSL